MSEYNNLFDELYTLCTEDEILQMMRNTIHRKKGITQTFDSLSLLNEKVKRIANEQIDHLINNDTNYHSNTIMIKQRLHSRGGVKDIVIDNGNVKHIFTMDGEYESRSSGW